MADFSPQENHVEVSSDEKVDSAKSPNSVSHKRVTTSPEASSTASDSPTPTNSVHEKNWSSRWQSLVCEEQRQLLGTEEESSDRQSDGESDVWEMSAEQREYYKTQFTTLQPDVGGLLPGHVARAFFEKSRLPLPELRKIWQLADVTKDGALSLEEFNVAMHLVVLRRNNISVPETLPPALAPPSPISVISSASPHHGKQWTKFIESPTSSISSPGPKPVNFDFHKAAVEQDPKILHPVAVRVTPSGELEDVPDQVSPIRPIQRPQPKKHQVASGPGSIPPPPPQASIDEPQVSSAKKDPPPPPPPRPYKQHTRSSSLDLTRLGRTAGSLNMPPVPPPRTSPGAMSPKKQVGQGDDSAFANFAQFQDESSSITTGAFHIYKKPSNSGEKTDDWSPIEDIPQDACNPRPTFFSIEAREAHNAALKKICHQLQSTLASLQEERASLQNVLDHLLCH